MWIGQILHSTMFNKRETVMRLYSLFDRKMREYGAIMQIPNDETAKRGLKEAINAKNANMSQLQKYPDDFDLMYIGEFDVETGVLSKSMVPVLVCNAMDLVVPTFNGQES